MVDPLLSERPAPVEGDPGPAELISWLDAIAEITRATHREAPLEELLDLIAGATARLTGYDFCAVLVEDRDRQALLIAGSYGLSPKYIDTINAQTPIPIRAGDASEGPSSRAFRSQRPTAVPDILADAPSRAWETVAARQGYSSLLAVPISAGQVPFGLLNCYSVEKREFTAREIILMESMANQAGLAIETTRRLTEFRQRAEQAAEGVTGLRAELDGLQHADDNHAKLLHVVLQGGGPDAIAETLSAMLACTVLVDDAAGRLLAGAGRAATSGSREARYRALHDKARARVGNSADVEIIAVPPARGAAHASAGLVVPVLLDEEVAGHVWALSPSTPFGVPHRRALVRAAAVVALALLKERAAQEVEWRMSRDFFDDLLDPHSSATTAALHGRARQLGADLTRRHTILVIRRDPVASDRPAEHENREVYAQRSLLSLIQRAGAAWKGATLTAARSDHVVVLWQEESARSATEFAHFLRREIQAYAAGWTATICMGPVCDDLSEYGDGYRLACGVTDLVQQSGGGDRVVSLEMIGAYRLLLQVKRPRELASFAQSTLGQMHDYDAEHGTKLGNTLRAYMDQRCHVATTARLLHVHPNTVAYRLRRIEELLGVDLDDPEALLHIQLALMIEGILCGS